MQSLWVIMCQYLLTERDSRSRIYAGVQLYRAKPVVLFSHIPSLPKGSFYNMIPSTTLIHLTAGLLYAGAVSATSESTYPQFSRDIMAKATENMIVTSTHS